MLRRRRSVLLATGGLAMAGVVAACGNPVTANRDFRAVTITVTVTQQVSGQPARVETINEGVALDGQGNQIKGTFLDETCGQIATTGAKQWRCLSYFAPGGSKLYVAGGLTTGPFGVQQMLDRADSTGTMSITKIKETPIPSNAHNVPKGAKAYIVRVALRKG